MHDRLYEEIQEFLDTDWNTDDGLPPKLYRDLTPYDLYEREFIGWFAGYENEYDHDAICGGIIDTLTIPADIDMSRITIPQRYIDEGWEFPAKGNWYSYFRDLTNEEIIEIAERHKAADNK